MCRFRSPVEPFLSACVHSHGLCFFLSSSLCCVWHCASRELPGKSWKCSGVVGDKVPRNNVQLQNPKVWKDERCAALCLVQDTMCSARRFPRRPRRLRQPPSVRAASRVGLQVVHFPGSIGQGCWGGLRAQLGHRAAVRVNTACFVLSKQQNSVSSTRCHHIYWNQMHLCL